MFLAKNIDDYLNTFKNKGYGASFKVGPALSEWGPLQSSSLDLPLYQDRVPAGFPSPADDYVETSLDLNKHLVKSPSSTFFVKVSGESMVNAGINDKDILVVDRSLEPKHGHIVIAVLNGELTVKRLSLKYNKVRLKPENPEYPIIEVGEDMEFLIWGVVTSVIHQFNHPKK